MSITTPWGRIYPSPWSWWGWERLSNCAAGVSDGNRIQTQLSLHDWSPMYLLAPVVNLSTWSTHFSWSPDQEDLNDSLCSRMTDFCVFVVWYYYQGLYYVT
jgi:hypothetical protein